MEQQLSSSFSLRAAYVAEQSRHEWQNLELNPPVVNGTRHLRSAGLRRRPTVAIRTNFITAANTGGNTNYNSLQVSAEQRVRYGLTLLFNYTWSKALDNMPYNQAATSIGGGNSFVYPITAPNFKRLDYGPTEFDHRDVTAASYVYKEPKVMNDAPAALRYLVNGYETTGLVPVPHRRPADHYFELKQQLRCRTRIAIEPCTTEPSPYGGTACASPVNCRNFLNPAAFSRSIQPVPSEM